MNDRMTTKVLKTRPRVGAASPITVSNEEDNYCMSNCNSQRQPSLYEQHCCNLGNIGNTIKFKNLKLHAFPPTYQPLVSSSTIIHHPPVQIYIKFIPVPYQDITISH